MTHILRFVLVAGRTASYLLIGVADVVLVARGERIGYIAAGLSGVVAGLRIMRIRLGRRQRELGGIAGRLYRAPKVRHYHGRRNQTQ